METQTPTPHTPIEGVTLWASGKRHAASPNVSAYIEVDGAPAGFISGSGDIRVETKRPASWAAPVSAYNTAHDLSAITAFRDSIRVIRRTPTAKACPLAEAIEKRLAWREANMVSSEPGWTLDAAANIAMREVANIARELSL